MKTTRSHRFLRYLLWHGQRVINWFRSKLIYARDARDLTHQLFSDISLLNEQDVSDTSEKLLEYCLARGYGPETQKIWKTHAYRLMLTEKWISDVLDLHQPQAKVLDLGVKDVAGEYWRFKFPWVQWENTDYDLRFPWKTTASSFDMILCTELVEHLSDQVNEQSFNEGFYKLGFMTLLGESFKALKPGGWLLITTPNAASVFHLKAVLRGDPPWFFIKHVREYTMPEVVELLKNAGFEIVRKQDIHCMTVMAYSDYTPIFQLLLENGFPTEGRGDDLFVLAHKPV
ncbi:MAG: hypothetical protein CVU44_15480 [Chloroflexi bacterium HGW-Chloroflexi-6]|nr:MAG: hypothetical protein CVU44_15480 [Chloroflexi bacterium HGW-Chloroflexi-6]